jgi:hypothetical protein
MAVQKKQLINSEPLLAGCTTYRDYLINSISDQLLKKISNGGLRGLHVNDAEMKAVQDKLLEIRKQKTLSVDDFHFILNKAIKEPSVEFQDKNPQLAIALQKYKAVTNLLNSVDDVARFRRLYQVYFRDIVKEKASADQNFMNCVAAYLGKASPNLFSPAHHETDFQKGDVVALAKSRNNRS